MTFTYYSLALINYKETMEKQRGIDMNLHTS